MQFVSKVNTGPNWTALDSWITAEDKTWLDDTPGPGAFTVAEQFVRDEIAELLALMADDRDRYLPETVEQADGVLFYYTGLLDMKLSNKPWTRALMAFALQVAEFVAMHFKRLPAYSRVRPSTLCPGLLAPFGPPRHASFPSGHSTAGHALSYVLLQIPAIKQRFDEELVWLARRVAIGRERIGVHYRSDSTAGMHLALGVITGLINWPNEAAVRTGAAEPVPTDPTDKFGKFAFSAIDLRCDKFLNPAANPANKENTYGLLDWAREEWT